MNTLINTNPTFKFNARLLEVFGTQYQLQGEYTGSKNPVTLLDTRTKKTKTLTPDTLFKNVKSHKQVSDITVLDSIMGSGKSTALSHHILSKSDEKFIVVLPLLSECHRFAQTVPTEDKAQNPKLLADGSYETIPQANPNAADLRSLAFKHPTSRKGPNGSKLNSLMKLLENGSNIVCTHALFHTLTDFSLLQDYNLIIDEAIDCFEPYDNLSVCDLKDHLGTLFTINKDNTLKFNREQIKSKTLNGMGPCQEWYDLTQASRLLYTGASVILKGLDTTVFHHTKSNLLCTYQFTGSVLHFYINQFDQFNITIKTLEGASLPSSMKTLINIVSDEDMNKVGAKAFSLSKNQVEGHLEELNENLIKFFTKSNGRPVSPKERLFTCFKRDVTEFETRFQKQHLAFNTKATNKYSDCTHVAFLVDLFLPPQLQNLNKGGNSTVKVNAEVEALNHMIQFIYRSAIRKGQAINLYVPSLRMRTLLQAWLNDEFVVAHPTF